MSHINEFKCDQCSKSSIEDDRSNWISIFNVNEEGNTKYLEFNYKPMNSLHRKSTEIRYERLDFCSRKCLHDYIDSILDQE